MRALGIGSIACTLSVLLSGWAGATPTDPALVLHDVRGAVGANATRVQAQAIYPRDDLVQIPYPVQLLIRDAAGGSLYLRIDLAGSAVSGSDSTLADGVSAAEALALLGQGVPEPNARIVLLGPDRIEVELPPSFPLADARALLFVEDEGSAILSNELQVQLVVGAP